MRLLLCSHMLLSYIPGGGRGVSGSSVGRIVGHVMTGGQVISRGHVSTGGHGGQVTVETVGASEETKEQPFNKLQNEWSQYINPKNPSLGLHKYNAAESITQKLEGYSFA